MREIEDSVGATVRLVRALGRRIGQDSPEELRHLLTIEGELDKALRVAVTRLRAQGFSDAHIGNVFGVTRQAVGQRWRRPR